ncbi:MAG: hypothetical protein SGARI_000050 [Bacillariaceae sp.]
MVKEIEDICSLLIEKLEKEESNNHHSGSDEADDSDSGDEDPFALARKKQAHSQLKGKPAGKPKSISMAEAEVDRYFEQRLRWEQHVPDGVNVGKTEPEYQANLIAIYRDFDVRRYWLLEGRRSFPLIFPVAMRALNQMRKEMDLGRALNAGQATKELLEKSMTARRTRTLKLQDEVEAPLVQDAVSISDTEAGSIDNGDDDPIVYDGDEDSEEEDLVDEWELQLFKDYKDTQPSDLSDDSADDED